MNWRSSRPRPAPSAVRTANSRWRVSARASSRFARFAHAISSTNPTARLQHPDRAAGAADDLFLHRLHLQDVAGAGVGLAIGFVGRQRREHVLLHADALAPVLDQRGELGLRLLRRDAVLQPADQIEKVAAAVLPIRRD